MIYHIFAEALLNNHINMCEIGRAKSTYTYINIPKYGDFGFRIMYNYEGLMAQPSRTGRNN